MSKIAKNIIGEIKEKHIIPISKWKLSAQEYIFWGIFGLSILFGAFSISVILFALLEINFTTISNADISVFFFVPSAWIIFLFMFFGLSFLIFRKTKKGYKIPFVYLIIGNLVGSMIIGGTIYAFGGEEKIEEAFAKAVPSYESIEKRHLKLWQQNPDKMLAGNIKSISEENILIIDFQEKTWRVDITHITPESKRFLEIAQEKEEDITNVKIKIHGEKADENLFIAEHIMPWHKRPFKFENGMQNGKKDGSGKNKLMPSGDLPPPPFDGFEDIPPPLKDIPPPPKTLSNR